jgi:hypothetical protein
MRPFTPRRGALVAALCLATATTACSSADKSQSDSTSAPTRAPESTAVLATNPGSTGGGTVAGKPFTTVSQFVQFDALANMWRLHITDASHTCTDDLASIRPAVGIDFIQPADAAATPPRIGTTTDGLGVVFIPADRNATFGPLTTTSGVTLTVDHDDLDVGRRWVGHLRVEPFEQDGLQFSYDGDLDAEVCPAVTP